MLRSLWDAGEFRVYCLDSDAWRGVCAATFFTLESTDGDGPGNAGRNSLTGPSYVTLDAMAARRISLGIRRLLTLRIE